MASAKPVRRAAVDCIESRPHRLGARGRMAVERAQAAQ